MIPRPYDAVAGAFEDPAINEALELTVHYAWLCRLTAEMDADAQADVKRALQIVQHTAMFQALRTRLETRAASEGKQADEDYPLTRDQGDISRTLTAVFLLKKVQLSSPETILADLASAGEKFSALAGYLQSNVAVAGAEYSVVKIMGYAEDGRPIVTDDAVKVDKPDTLSTFITDAKLSR